MSNYDIKNDTNFIVEFDKNIYDIEDIKSAYDLLKNRCTILLSDSVHSIKAEIQCHNISSKKMLDEFLYTLSNQQIKSQLLKNNAKLRDLIVEQAFKPLKDLEERVNEL